MEIYRINETFWEHIHKYDAMDPAILKKIVHSFAVANCAFDIACHLNYNQHDRLFCYIMGLYHDIGRFEQWKLYHTYDDNKSGSHGELGVKMFKQYINASDLGLNAEDIALLLDTIKYHIDVYKGNDSKLLKFLKIIHSADAYSNIPNFALGNQDFSGVTDGYSKEIMDKFYNKEPLFNVSAKTKLDRLLKTIMATNYVKFPHLRQYIIDNNYVEILYDVYKNNLNEEDRLVYRKAVDFWKENYKAEE